MEKSQENKGINVKIAISRSLAFAPRGYPPETKARALELYNHGLSIRSAARLSGVSRTSVLNWIKQAAKKNI